ncbi:DUF4013 domain-containing protein [Haloferax namakaokahaiae]|uniref:DUF4013 domain-containing protein n=1 Tax=Haloferax namakaokahaiae TaxID=1748331 RepID=A0ABD5ZGK8_9EURY
MDASDFESAFALPFANDTSFDTVVAGVLLTLATLSTPLAGVLLVGYLARLVRGGERNASSLPAFDDFVGMAVEGTRLSTVLVALQLPAVAIAAGVFELTGARLAALSFVADPTLLSYVSLSAVAVAGLVVAGLAALAGMYVSAAMLVAVAHERSLLAALPAARTLVFDTSFATVVSAAVLVGFGGRLLEVLFGTFPVVGVVLAAVVSFLTLVAAATLLGRGAPDCSQESLRTNAESNPDALGSA